MASNKLVAVVYSFTLVAYGFAADMLIPKKLLLGAGVSSYQVEGGWNASGKGENIWDWWTHHYPDRILDHSDADETCDSYHKYKEDVRLLKEIGVDVYRFSISWSRVLPNGFANAISHDGLNYYRSLINELVENGIHPHVTLYHWDHPQNLEELGGWLNDTMIEWISDYARIVFAELGHKIKYFTTINEPNILCTWGYGEDIIAPGRNLGDYGKFLCMHNVLKAHARIYHIYDSEFRKRQKGQIGIPLPCFGIVPKTENDVNTTDTYFQFTCGWPGHPIFSKTGDYPEIVKRHVAENSRLANYSHSLLPEFSKEWVEYIRGTSDFFGLNHYSSKIVEPVPKIEGQPWYDNSGVKTTDLMWPSTNASNGFRDYLNLISREYDNPVIHILENGLFDSRNIADCDRINYLCSYIAAMLAAIKEDACNVRMYTVWSFLDNFEWNNGYTKRFGLVQVDFNSSSKTRTRKWSSEWYARVIETGKLQSDPRCANVTFGP